jgi:hypothetical protein
MPAKATETKTVTSGCAAFISGNQLASLPTVTAIAVNPTSSRMYHHLFENKGVILGFARRMNEGGAA